MRLYSFVNSYLSGAQVGIQTAHGVAELLSSHKNCSDILHTPESIVAEWVTKHKTIICLDGGIEDELDEIYHFVATKTMWPVAYFREPDLADVMTSVVVILSERIYSFSNDIRRLGLLVDESKFELSLMAKDRGLNDVDLKIAKLIASSSLAR
jgi:hypothetical protein